PGLSYSEALCEIEYLLGHPDLRPSLIVLQMNYQAFWNGGIRDSFLELLDDRAFRQQARQLAQSRKAYADDFASALLKYEEREASPRSANPPQDGGFGSPLDTFARQKLSAVTV